MQRRLLSVMLTLSFAGSLAVGTTARAEATDVCARLSAATVKALLRGGSPKRTTSRPNTCGWGTGESPVPKAGASLVYWTYPSVAEAQKQFTAFAGFSGATKQSGIGDEAVTSEHPHLSALTARTGALFIHIEEGGSATSSKPLVAIAKSLVATGKA